MRLEVPTMLHRKFAAIKLWSDRAAEDEVIERLKIAAKLLDLECLVVDSFARLIHPPHTQLTQDDVDFVLSLHFETPKRFDIFSFVTLWNPLQFYSFREGGYRQFTRNLLTHDDFLSCDSVSGDNHVMRFSSSGLPRERPLFRFYPTLSGPLLEPTLGDQKIFYVGINWEKLWKKPGRHDELLSLLDASGDLRLYGPKIHGGVEVWQGFNSYVGSIPFDGVSVVRLINRAGISLVLSSTAHRESEMMSSRIFESAAAGAVILCDENPFARRHFADSLLYIDATLSPQETFGQVQSHLAWIKSEPEKALDMAKQAQNIFREKFRLDTCLERIYSGLSARKAQICRGYMPKNSNEKICVVFLMPAFSPEILELHLASYQAQRNVAVRGVLAMDARDAEIFAQRVECRLHSSQVPLEIIPVQFWERRRDGSVKYRRPVGEAISELIRGQIVQEYFCFVAPHERLFSNHLSSLLRRLQESAGSGCAWCDMLDSHQIQDGVQADLADDPDSTGDDPIGFGRFLFRTSAIQERIHTALPYLDTLAIHALFGTIDGAPTRRCTLLANRNGANQESLPLALEREILIDLSPNVFVKKAAAEIEPALPTEEPELAAPPMTSPAIPDQQIQPPGPVPLTLAGMTQEERAQLAVELAHSIPIPPLVKKLVFGTYRLWFRMAGSRERNGASGVD